jgi:hypothetical protein
MPHARTLLRWLLALALIAAVAPPACAGRVYRWTDRDGVVHYDGTRPDLPDAEVTVLPFLAEPGAMARLRLETDADSGGYLAIADNTLAGPIEVMLRGDGMVVGEPELPARATIPALGSVVVARLHGAPSQDGGTRGGRFEVRLETVPGSPNAKPQDDEYAFPLRTPTPRVEQGYGGSFSHHDDENRYAVDFAAAIGTPVLAARGGTVMQVESDFDQASLSAERFGGRANFVRILHDDGSMAVYAHLALEGVLVRAGQRVARGQTIGLSGNTGFSSGPHLHFVVQVNRGMRLVAIPFRMFGPQGILRFSEARSSDAGDGR